jgi:hypothetical protein
MGVFQSDIESAQFDLEKNQGKTEKTEIRKHNAN